MKFLEDFSFDETFLCCSFSVSPEVGQGIIEVHYRKYAQKGRHWGVGFKRSAVYWMNASCALEKIEFLSGGDLHIFISELRSSGLTLATYCNLVLEKAKEVYGDREIEAAVDAMDDFADTLRQIVAEHLLKDENQKKLNSSNSGSSISQSSKEELQPFQGSRKYGFLRLAHSRE